jgi:hypothetical protein
VSPLHSTRFRRGQGLVGTVAIFGRASAGYAQCITFARTFNFLAKHVQNRRLQEVSQHPLSHLHLYPDTAATSATTPMDGNFYRLLGVKHGASEADIKRAYIERVRAAKDAFGVDSRGSEQYAFVQALNEAKQTLLDPELRARHDDHIAESTSRTTGDDHDHDVDGDAPTPATDLAGVIGGGPPLSTTFRELFLGSLDRFSRGVIVVNEWARAASSVCAGVQASEDVMATLAALRRSVGERGSAGGSVTGCMACSRWDFSTLESAWEHEMGACANSPYRGFIAAHASHVVVVDAVRRCLAGLGGVGPLPDMEQPPAWLTRSSGGRAWFTWAPDVAAAASRAADDAHRAVNHSMTSAAGIAAWCAFAPTATTGSVPGRLAAAHRAALERATDDAAMLMGSFAWPVSAVLAMPKRTVQQCMPWSHVRTVTPAVGEGSLAPPTSLCSSPSAIAVAADVLRDLPSVSVLHAVAAGTPVARGGASAACERCGTAFMWLRWRHTCRGCRANVCASCEGLVPAPRWGFLAPVPLCRVCILASISVDVEAWVACALRHAAVGHDRGALACATVVTRSLAEMRAVGSVTAEEVAPVEAAAAALSSACVELLRCAGVVLVGGVAGAPTSGCEVPVAALAGAGSASASVAPASSSLFVERHFVAALAMLETAPPVLTPRQCVEVAVHLVQAHGCVDAAAALLRSSCRVHHVHGVSTLASVAAGDEHPVPAIVRLLCHVAVEESQGRSCDWHVLLQKADAADAPGSGGDDRARAIVAVALAVGPPPKWSPVGDTLFEAGCIRGALLCWRLAHLSADSWYAKVHAILARRGAVVLASVAQLLAHADAVVPGAFASTSRPAQVAPVAVASSTHNQQDPADAAWTLALYTLDVRVQALHAGGGAPGRSPSGAAVAPTAVFQCAEALLVRAWAGHAPQAAVACATAVLRRVYGTSTDSVPAAAPGVLACMLALDAASSESNGVSSPSARWHRVVVPALAANPASRAGAFGAALACGTDQGAWRSVAQALHHAGKPLGALGALAMSATACSLASDTTVQLLLDFASAARSGAAVPADSACYFWYAWQLCQSIPRLAVVVLGRIEEAFGLPAEDAIAGHAALLCAAARDGVPDTHVLQAHARLATLLCGQAASSGAMDCSRLAASAITTCVALSAWAPSGPPPHLTRLVLNVRGSELVQRAARVTEDAATAFRTAYYADDYKVVSELWVVGVGAVRERVTGLRRVLTEQGIDRIDTLPRPRRAYLLIARGATERCDGDCGAALSSVLAAATTYPVDSVLGVVAGLLAEPAFRLAILTATLDDVRTYINPDAPAPHVLLSDANLEPPALAQHYELFRSSADRRAMKRCEQGVAGDVATRDGAFEAAMLYVDLTRAALDSGMVCGCFVVSALWLLKAQRLAAARASSITTVASLWVVLVDVLKNAVALSRRQLSPPMQMYVCRLTASVLRASASVVQRCSAAAPVAPRAFASELNLFDPTVGALVALTLGDLCEGVGRWPLAAFPVVQAVDMTAMTLAGAGTLLPMLVAYAGLSLPADGPSSTAASSPPDHAVSQVQACSMLVEGAWKGWYDRSFEQARADAIEIMLAEKRLSVTAVERAMSWPLLHRDAEGFWNGRLRSLAFTAAGYKAITGFRVNHASGEVTLTVERAATASETLFDDSDIAAVLREGLTFSFFTLEAPDHKTAPYHPFQEQKFAPACVEGTGVLPTLLHADLLLKYLSTGVEVSARGPAFHVRRVDGPGGLLSGLPEPLRQLVRPVGVRTGSTEHPNRAHRFWFEPDVLEYDHVVEAGAAGSGHRVESFMVHPARMRVRKHLLSTSAHGELTDDDNDSGTDDDADPEDPAVSAEMKFANDVTFAFADLRRYFPVLARMQELHRLMGVCALLLAVRESVTSTIDGAVVPDDDARELLQRLQESLSTFPLDEDTMVEDQLQKTLAANGVSRYQVRYFLHCRFHCFSDWNRALKRPFLGFSRRCRIRS